jgi:hypothetical protein
MTKGTVVFVTQQATKTTVPFVKLRIFYVNFTKKLLKNCGLSDIISCRSNTERETL